MAAQVLDLICALWLLWAQIRTLPELHYLRLGTDNRTRFIRFPHYHLAKPEARRVGLDQICDLTCMIGNYRTLDAFPLQTVLQEMIKIEID